MLNGVRANLSSVVCERSRATELLCHSISSSYDGGNFLTLNARHLKTSSAPSILLGSSLTNAKSNRRFIYMHICTIITYCIYALNDIKKLITMCILVPVLIKCRYIVVFLSNTGGPLDPLTPSAVNAMQNAEEICQKSCQLKEECLAVCDEVNRQHQSMHNLVNHTLIQRVAESVTLSVRNHYNNHYYITQIIL